MNLMERMSMQSEDRQGPFIICNIMRAWRGESELLLPPAYNMMEQTKADHSEDTAYGCHGNWNYRNLRFETIHVLHMTLFYKS